MPGTVRKQGAMSSCAVGYFVFGLRLCGCTFSAPLHSLMWLPAIRVPPTISAMCLTSAFSHNLDNPHVASPTDYPPLLLADRGRHTMWLLDASTIRLESFFEEANTPAYAILSHTWGKEEVSFRDLEYAHEHPGSPRANKILQSQGYLKILNCCARALTEGLVSKCLVPMRR